MDKIENMMLADLQREGFDRFQGLADTKAPTYITELRRHLYRIEEKLDRLLEAQK